LLHFTYAPEEVRAKKLKQHVENGVELSCFQVEQEKFKGNPHEVCVDAASHEILSEEWQEPPDERRREQFSGYSDFGGHRFPQRLQFQEDGIMVVTANVTGLKNASFDKALLAAPKGAIERRHCADMKRAVPVKTPDPLYPKSASRNKLMGDTTVAMTVLTDGSVSNIQVLGRATQSMDDATLETLKGWRFKPAMCGANPVVSDIVVVVSFRLQ
jgi:TonB family protein